MQGVLGRHSPESGLDHWEMEDEIVQVRIFYSTHQCRLDLGRPALTGQGSRTDDNAARLHYGRRS